MKLIIYLFHRHCNDPISTQYEFELNLIENEQYNHIERDFSQIANVKTSDHTEIESLACSSQNGNLLLITCKYTYNPILYNSQT